MATEPDADDFGYAGTMNKQMGRARKKVLAGRPKRGAVHVTNVIHLHVEAAKKIKHKGA
jgi:hypothetical protein